MWYYEHNGENDNGDDNDNDNDNGDDNEKSWGWYLVGDGEILRRPC